MEEKIFDITELVDPDELYSFYGVNIRHFKIGGVVFEAREDEEDGYRSSLDCIPRVHVDKIFSKKPIANIRITKDSDGYIKLLDASNHCWLKIGTDYSDDYYPCFVFKYTPNETKTTFSEELDPLVVSAEKFI